MGGSYRRGVGGAAGVSADAAAAVGVVTAVVVAGAVISIFQRRFSAHL